jgi:hypothetical protein
MATLRETMRFAAAPATPRHQLVAFVIMVAVLLVAPQFVYPSSS